ncbi:MAG TPA: precorrin-2 C(20)-methyltransferase [Solirubrobacteraceae bacterium]|nr:precorrin-2 C(20)-methyltransferase [Solirubrobacteraceae bacterium]
MTGRLFGVGVGPGDPELVTVRARRLIESADVIAYTTARGRAGVARGAAAPYMAQGQLELELAYPVTTGGSDHPGGYEGALREFYDRAAQRIASHLDAGRDVAVLCEGDPFLYGSYMYLHERLADRYPTEVVPGVTSFSAAAAAAGAPMARRDEVLAILPGTLPREVLEARLRELDAAVVLKLGRTFDHVRDAVGAAGVARRAIYVERASSPRQRIAPLREVDGRVPYMSLVLIPSCVGRTTTPAATPDAPRAPRTATLAAAPPDAPDAPRTASPAASAAAEGTGGCPAGGTRRSPGALTVVGLGPAGARWLTPEALEELLAAEELVGYAGYLARVPERPGQRRHASDNRAEGQRARHALRLAAAGARVAVVSSGDPGIFAMAAAVLEEYERGEREYQGVRLRVLPGISAMQAAAARVGAPLGHDFCVLSLSDNLKPWETVERRLRAAGEADLALALYNPSSRSRAGQLKRALEVLAEHRDRDTPVVVARAVGWPEESVTVTTLGRVRTESVDMRTLLIVGSSTTRVMHGPPPRVYTPRSYPAHGESAQEARCAPPDDSRRTAGAVADGNRRTASTGADGNRRTVSA